jgi:hypothetical protein
MLRLRPTLSHVAARFIHGATRRGDHVGDIEILEHDRPEASATSIDLPILTNAVDQRRDACDAAMLLDPALGRTLVMGQDPWRATLAATRPRARLRM